MAGTRRLPRSTPESHGVSIDHITAFLDDVERSGLELHSLMVLRHGSVVSEGWWHPYRAEVVHELYSLSKSFTATAVGFAQAEGLLDVDDLVLDHLGDLAPQAPAEHLTTMRLRHLLTMTTGHDQDPTDRVFSSQDWERTFLALPVEHEPGTHFVYNTAATYLLSAIVQWRTGQRLLDYLGPRLLDPLGIRGAVWAQSPTGVDEGGTGLSVTTEDIACFGQLYLDDGMWGGRRVLPEGWVEQATILQVPSVHDEVDWRQGYGYQFWRCRHGAYRADGAFGQFCVVMPEQAAVVAITAGTPDMQGVLDRVWTHLLPAMGAPVDPREGHGAQHGSGDGAPQASLTDRLGALRLRPPVVAHTGSGRPPMDLTGRTVTLPAADATGPGRATIDAAGPAVALRLIAGVDSVTIGETDAFGVPTSVTLRSGDYAETVFVGADEWALGMTRMGDRPTPGAGPGRPIAAAAAWTAPDSCTAQIRWYDTPYCLTIAGSIDGDRVTIRPRLNVSFGPTELEPIEARLEG